MELFACVWANFNQYVSLLLATRPRKHSGPPPLPHSQIMNLCPFQASLVILLFLLLTFPPPTTPLPLSTSGRWIVDEYAHRVKLACINWPSHLQPMVAEGLNKRTLDSISKSVVSMGFNCVRFTWPLYLVTNDSLATVTVRQSFQWLGLDAAIAGIQENNPWILDQTLIQAFKVSYL